MRNHPRPNYNYKYMWNVSNLWVTKNLMNIHFQVFKYSYIIVLYCSRKKPGLSFEQDFKSN